MLDRFRLVRMDQSCLGLFLCIGRERLLLGRVSSCLFTRGQGGLRGLSGYFRIPAGFLRLLTCRIGCDLGPLDLAAT